ncbi:hypothetical protein BDV96DRAFT_112585 [Lophiotrema nucula]|uniref:HNH nuclease domain-containing protein n=1 Tax=Lophiotrema nucula TaxID=690887 RepID=A0A6A5Z5F5_9PLEO|nr:hypothetical protein BDV96DRAFT_112585 [Lophiotrema nucula]
MKHRSAMPMSDRKPTPLPNAAPSILSQALARFQKKLFSDRYDNAPPVKRLKDETEDEWSTKLRKASDEYHECRLVVTEAAKLRLNNSIAAAHALYEEGVMSEGEYNNILARCELDLAEWRAEAQLLRHRRGSLGDDFVARFEGKKILDEGYIFGLVNTGRLPHGATVQVKEAQPETDSARQRFRKRLIHYYHAANRDPKFPDRLWCSITRSYRPGSVVTAAHISPINLNAYYCEDLYGRAENAILGHTWSPSNGLLIQKCFEEALDEGRIVIVPASENDVDPELGDDTKRLPLEGRFKVVVLDDAFVANNDFAGVNHKHIDGRILEFKSGGRPLKRYLYVRCQLTIFARRRFIVPGFANDVARIERAVEKVSGSSGWTSPGEYLKRSTIICMARRVGYERDPVRFLHEELLKGDAKPTEIDERTTEMAHESTMSSRNVVLRRRAAKKTSSGDELEDAKPPTVDWDEPQAGVGTRRFESMAGYGEVESDDEDVEGEADDEEDDVGSPAYDTDDG